MLRLLRRNLKVNSVKTKEKAYKTFIRPLLVEYACTVWDPTTQKVVAKIEMIQRRAASVGEMLKTLFSIIDRIPD